MQLPRQILKSSNLTFLIKNAHCFPLLVKIIQLISPKMNLPVSLSCPTCCSQNTEQATRWGPESSDPVTSLYVESKQDDTRKSSCNAEEEKAREIKEPQGMGLLAPQALHAQITPVVSERTSHQVLHALR